MTIPAENGVEAADPFAGPDALAAAVSEAVRRTADLTASVDELIMAVQLTLAPHRRDRLAEDVLADLRALRGCLATGAALAEPSRERLQRLADQDTRMDAS